MKRNDFCFGLGIIVIGAIIFFNSGSSLEDEPELLSADEFIYDNLEEQVLLMSDEKLRDIYWDKYWLENPDEEGLSIINSEMERRIDEHGSWNW